MAFISYVGIFIIACTTAIWYFNGSKDSPNQFPRPILTSCWWVLRYHLGSIALGAFILAVVWTIRIMLAYVAAKIQEMKARGVQNKALEMTISCLMCIVACFERFIKFVSKIGFAQIAVSSENFCTSCFKAMTLLIMNPMSFGLVTAFGAVFVFIGKLFVSAVCGVSCYLIITRHDDLDEELHSIVLPIVISMALGYFIADVFFDIYEVAADTIILCFFWDKEIASKGGRPVTAPAPMKSFYEKYKKN